MPGVAAPPTIIVPFANAGTKNTPIPVPSQIGITPGAASYDDGFPPLCLTPVASGGVPPFGQDMNGILYAVTANAAYLTAGQYYPFSSTIATAIGGYALGCVLAMADNSGLWLNIVSGNSNNPDTSAAGSGWVPLIGYGWATITGLTNANHTLTAVEAGKSTIELEGTLTGNVAIEFPTTLQSWKIINACTGAFTLTCKTTAGTGVIVPQGGVTAPVTVFGDGTNLYQSASTAGVNAGTPASYKNLKANAPGTDKTVTLTADSLSLANGSQYLVVSAVNVTLNLGSAGANGLDTGSVAANTWYSVWVIATASGTVAALGSLSATAPTLPSGYIYAARFGWARTDGSEDTLSFQQAGSRVQYKVATGSNVAALIQIGNGPAGSISVPTWAAIAVASYVPSTAATIKGLLNTSSDTGMAAPNNEYGAFNSGSNPPPIVSSDASAYLSLPFEFVLEGADIYWAGQSAANLFVIGWEDNI
jgi:hypothetical protein